MFEIKIGRTDDVLTSYTLFAWNGLRLATESLSFRSPTELDATASRFLAVVDRLRMCGVLVTAEPGVEAEIRARADRHDVQTTLDKLHDDR